MTVDKAKREAVETGSCELVRGVYLLTGTEVLKEAEGYDDPDDPERINGDYDKSDIIPDQLYIQACPDAFHAADDDDIEEILNND
jgi:hypothetical protein